MEIIISDHGNPTGPDSQVAPAHPRQFYHSVTSFLSSLLVHLVLLILFSCYWLAGQTTSRVSLEAGRGSDVDVGDELSVSFDLSLDTSVLDSEIEPLDQPELSLIEDLTAHPQQDPIRSSDIEFGNILGSAALNGLTSTMGDGEGIEGSSSSSNSQFFGIGTKGDRIVYIIDISPSMGIGKYQTRLERAMAEVVRSVNMLEPHQKFYVILFSYTTTKVQIDRSGHFSRATDENKAKLEKELRTVEISTSGTDPREAIVWALDAKPTCVFLLSDGEFNGELNRNSRFHPRIRASELAVKHNVKRCPINTIGFEDLTSQPVLTQIAKESKGTYVFVPPED